MFQGENDSLKQLFLSARFYLCSKEKMNHITFLFISCNFYFGIIRGIDSSQEFLYSQQRVLSAVRGP